MTLFTMIRKQVVGLRRHIVTFVRRRGHAHKYDAIAGEGFGMQVVVSFWFSSTHVAKELHKPPPPANPVSPIISNS